MEAAAGTPAWHRLLAPEWPVTAWAPVEGRRVAAVAPAARWLILRLIVERWLASIGDRWSAVGLGPSEESGGDELARRDILDREADRFEDGDRIGWTLSGPAILHRADLHEIMFGQ